MPIALVIKICVRPDAVASFPSWHARMTTAPAAVEGFVSSEVNEPGHGELAWSVVHNFRHADALKAWRASAAYHGLLREAQTLVDAADAQALREDEVAEGMA